MTTRFIDIQRNPYEQLSKHSGREQSDSHGEVYVANCDCSDMAARRHYPPLFNMCASL
jgi:hypothetical protein